ncbi:MAG: hypothetical protein FWD17_13240 [Polyangiaceae bacterium]|nr:hypothetical protein [Polyangiaceae bacterium]
MPSGPATDRCSLPDGGLQVQSVDPASCSATGDGGSSDTACVYGDTLFGQQGPDDDCKYEVSWTSTSLCEGAPGVVFTLQATYLDTTMPVTGAHTRIEYFVEAPDDGGSCGGVAAHIGPTFDPSGGFYEMSETTPGTYVGQIRFDASGPWTIRFHFDEDCSDTVDDSPHGHAAFHLLLP